MATPPAENRTLLAKRPSQTKIVATVGPASDGPVMIERLIVAGVDVFRLNMAHGDPNVQQSRLDTIREVRERLAQPVAVLADLAGPKIRLGLLPGGMFRCQAGATVRFVREPSTTPGDFTCTYETLIDELEVGDRVMLADGTVSLYVERTMPDVAVCRVVQPGIVRSRQGVNLPGVKLRIPTLQPVDRENAAWAARAGVDFLGLSFVRTADDIQELRRIIAGQGGHAQIIAKIEKPEALENLESIVDTADGVMVARGDLGVETDIARIAVVQKQVIDVCRRWSKPVITATQMLDSMQHEMLPTRAEATDVANAILDGTDACMLSGETAIGSYPVEAVEMMHRIALATESIGRLNPSPRSEQPAVHDRLDRITRATTEAAGQLATQLDAAVVLVATTDGEAALALSKQRRAVPTFGVSTSGATLRRMALYWGVVPLSGVPASDLQAAYESLIERGKEDGFLATGDRVVLVAGTDISGDQHNSVQVHVIE